jgi:predicted O-methyltransferase YrrM
MGSIRKFDIKNIKEKQNINIFVETGTLYGDGVDYALSSGFDTIISIEINAQLAQAAREKYKNIPQVQIIEGNSAEVIDTICKQIQEPILFWLDAHFPGADAGLCGHLDEADYNARVPLEKELESIYNRNKKDIIICDDLWMYEDGPYESGTFNEHSKRHGHNITREQVCGHDLSHFYNLFSNTHNFKKYYSHQGYLVMLPKHDMNKIKQIHSAEFIPRTNPLVDWDNIPPFVPTSTEDRVLQFICMYGGKSRKIFEFGTWIGRSALGFSKNFEHVMTMDYIDGSDINYAYSHNNAVYKSGELILNVPNVTFINENSLSYNFDSLIDTFDVVFVDGNHSFNGCMEDMRNAMKICKKNNSIIFIHDYSNSGMGVKAAVDNFNHPNKCYITDVDLVALINL